MQIQVVGGPQNGREIWIEQEISRVGSHPSADFRLEGMAPHAVTIQQRGKTIAIFPRAEGITIQGHPLGLGQAVAWKQGQEVKVGPGVRLRLLSTDDGPPQVEPWAWNHAQEGSGAAGERDSELGDTVRQTNSTVKLVLSGFCLAISGLMVLDLAGSGPVDPVSRNDFESIISSIQLLRDSAERTYLRETLQEGYFYRARGDNERASQRFSDLRDRYLLMRKEPTFESDELEARICHFVKKQLAELKSKANREFLQ